MFGDTMAVTTVNGIAELKAKAGSHLGYSEWREISQDRINRFADATDDHQWIHVDVERAKTGPFGGTIAHGDLTLSLAVPMLEEVLDVKGIQLIVNYGLNRVRFAAAVPAGSRIRLGAVLKEVTDVAGGAQAVIDATYELDGGTKPPCVAEIVFRYYERLPLLGVIPRTTAMHAGRRRSMPAGVSRD
jgi:acyl dehydratase